MASLANQTISSTYDGLIKTSTDEPVGASGVQLLEDGVGNSLALSIGRLNNGITVTGTVTATAFVGDGSGLTGISVSPTLDEVTTNGATTTNNITVGNVTASSFIKSGGTSSQFLKADGSVDSSTYLTSFTETNDLTAAVTWANVPDANITQSSVTQHQAALSITESQISDLQSYLTSESDTLDTVTDRGATTTNAITVGGISITGTLLDSNGQAGTSGQILSSTATGIDWVDAAAGGGDVTSVNGQTGVVVLDADDIDDTSTTNKFTTAGDISKLAGIEALADVTDATNVAAAGALMSGTAQLSDLVDVSSATPSDGQVLTYDTVNGWQPENATGGGGSDYTIQEISTNTTAVKDNLYVFTASLTLTLPASPSVGDKVGIANMSGTNTPVVARNGNLLIGVAEDLTIDVQNIAVEFIYSGATEGWIMFADAIYGAASTGGGGTVDGNGTTNYISKWSDADTLTDSVIYDDGTNVGIGTSSPASKLEILGNQQVLSLRGATSDYSALNFYVDNGNAAYIQSTEVGAGTVLPIAFTMKGAEAMRILSSGGITFNGDTAAANALDDYEEGTWTVDLTFGGNSVGITYLRDTGTYTKIGRQVTLTFPLRLSNKGSSTGNARIGGLPFNIGNSDIYYTGVTFGYLQNITFSDVIVGYGVYGSNIIELYQTTNAGVSSTITNLNFTNSTNIICSMVYFTA